MAANRIRTTAAGSDTAPPVPVRDPDVVAGFLEDASGTPGGHASGVVRVRSEAEVAALLSATAGQGVAVLAQGSRSSLTGGAVPRGDLVLAFEEMAEIREVRGGPDDGFAVAEAGVRLDVLQARVREEGLDYPPIPTHREASLGGTVSTNAGGPATFKHGVTRDWIRRVRGVLANGEILDVRRGKAVAAAGSAFEIERVDGTVTTIPVPSSYRTPPLRKVSAGYHVKDETDLVDLLVGSEGTLLVVTEVEVALGPRPAGEVAGVVFLDGLPAALETARTLREASRTTWRDHDPMGVDVRAIELLDDRCLSIILARNALRDVRLEIPSGTGAAVLFEVELKQAVSAEDALEALESSLAGETIPDGPLPRLYRLLAGHAPLERIELAFPGDEIRRRALYRLRESAPESIFEIVSERKAAGADVRKVGGDAIVPFEALSEVIPRNVEAFTSRGLECALWGHVSDGNLHPNAMPRDADEVRRAEDAVREMAALATELGGAPLSEHGVGRSELKQELLRDFYGPQAIDEMREVKKALDPEWRLAPGVLFPREARSP